MNCIKAYGGNNLLNLAIKKFYTTNRSKFKGNGKSDGYTYTYDISEMPVANLLPNETVKNFEIVMNNVVITAKGNNVNINNNIKLVALCKLAIVKKTSETVLGQIIDYLIPKYELSLKILKIVSPSTNIIDQIIVGILNSQVIPKINDTLKELQIPQIIRLFGSNLSARLKTFQVIQGPAFEVGATLVGKTNLGEANYPTANINALNIGNNSALVVGTISSQAINTIIKEIILPFEQNFRKTKGKGGLKGKLKVEFNSLEIKNNDCLIDLSVSINKFQGGIYLPIVDWEWFSLPSQKINLKILNKLSVNGNAALLTLTDLTEFKMSINWPTSLKLVKTILSSLLESEIKSFIKSEIKKQIISKKIEIFKLPSTIPGTNLSASLTFEKNGLEYYNSSLKALVKIQI